VVGLDSEAVSAQTHAREEVRVQVVFEASGPAEGRKEPMRLNLFQASWGPGHGRGRSQRG